jgi:hypothetical protein
MAFAKLAGKSPPFYNAPKASADRLPLRYPREVTDAICGHAQASEGRKYDGPTLGDKSAKLAKFPRYRFHAT